MLRRVRDRILFTVFLALAGSLLGTGAGYLLGCGVALRVAENWLNQYAMRIRVMGEQSSLEGRRILAVIGASPFPRCSDEEIEWIRELVFRAEYIKDAGHMREGRITCSATTGRDVSAVERFDGDFEQRDGTVAYSDLSPVSDPGVHRVGLRKGDTYVVFGSHVPARLGPVPMVATITTINAPGRRWKRLEGGMPPLPVEALTEEGIGRQGGVLYATQCSRRYSNCVTAYTPLRDAIAAEFARVTGGAVSGAVLGGLLGVAFALAYRRSRSHVQQLRRAVRRGDLHMVYQPVVDMTSGRAVGAEALVRWTDEDGFTVPPDVFVRIAEERGFVGEITQLVVQRVLRDWGAKLRQPPGFHINVNVTASDLVDPAFLPMLGNALRTARVSPESIGIEITESCTARKHVAMEAVRALRERGHTVYIDDFGTGYSSLAYLHDLSVDVIKIDRSFTQAIGTEAVTVNILPQILAMAEALDLQVVVEGIETAQQAQYFGRYVRPVLAQGWFYGRPLDVGTFVEYMRSNERACNGRAAADETPYEFIAL